MGIGLNIHGGSSQDSFPQVNSSTTAEQCLAIVVGGNKENSKKAPNESVTIATGGFTKKIEYNNRGFGMDITGTQQAKVNNGLAHAMGTKVIASGTSEQR